MFLCVLVLFYCVGCNKTNEKSSISNENNYVYEDNDTIDEQPKSTIEKESSEDIEEYEIKENIIFYVLKDEYFENNDTKNPNVCMLTRVYICYDGVKNQTYPYTNQVALDKVDSIQEFRENLIIKKSKSLKLFPNTIVSEKVLKKWESQNYDGLSSYSDESPSGLTYSEIQ